MRLASTHANHIQYPLICNSALPAAIRLSPVPDGPGVILAFSCPHARTSCSQCESKSLPPIIVTSSKRVSELQSDMDMVNALPASPIDRKASPDGGWLMARNS